MNYIMQRNLRIHLANVLLLIVVANSNTSLVGWMDGWMEKVVVVDLWQ